MPKRISIEERPNRRQPYESKMRYAVMFDGKEFSDLYYNMRGYRGAIPWLRDDGTIGSFDPGEVSITQFRREVADANRRLA